MDTLDLLSQPLALPCGAVVPNRLCKAAMSEQLAGRDAAPSEPLIRLYERWARSGAGLQLTGHVMVDRTAPAENGNVAIDDRCDGAHLRRWAATMKSGNAMAWVQLNHPGRQSFRAVQRHPVAPSAVPRPLTAPEIEALVQRFARAAQIAVEAGFDGVQVHAAHGYLISQFLSPLTNRREDDWGGAPDKRRRFLLEVVRAIRSRVGPAVPVAVKLNSADFQRGGFCEEESLSVVEALAAEQVDLIEISGGTYESTAMFLGPDVKESTRSREAYFLAFAEKVRARAPVPLMVTGGFRSAAGMAAAIASGATDLVGMARPLALEPDLPARLLSGAATASVARSRRVGIRMLDALSETHGYQQQIHRMAEGLEPDPRRGTWRALALEIFRTVTARAPRPGLGDGRGASCPRR